MAGVHATEGEARAESVQRVGLLLRGVAMLGVAHLHPRGARGGGGLKTAPGAEGGCQRAGRGLWGEGCGEDTQ